MLKLMGLSVARLEGAPLHYLAARSHDHVRKRGVPTQLHHNGLHLRPGHTDAGDGCSAATRAAPGHLLLVLLAHPSCSMQLRHETDSPRQHWQLAVHEAG